MEDSGTSKKQIPISKAAVIICGIVGHAHLPERRTRRSLPDRHDGLLQESPGPLKRWCELNLEIEAAADRRLRRPDDLEERRPASVNAPASGQLLGIRFSPRFADLATDQGTEGGKKGWHGAMANVRLIFRG